MLAYIQLPDVGHAAFQAHSQHPDVIHIPILELNVKSVGFIDALLVIEGGCETHDLYKQLINGVDNKSLRIRHAAENRVNQGDVEEGVGPVLEGYGASIHRLDKLAHAALTPVADYGMGFPLLPDSSKGSRHCSKELACPTQQAKSCKPDVTCTKQLSTTQSFRRKCKLSTGRREGALVQKLQQELLPMAPHA